MQRWEGIGADGGTRVAHTPLPRLKYTDEEQVAAKETASFDPDSKEVLLSTLSLNPKQERYVWDVHTRALVK